MDYSTYIYIYIYIYVYTSVLHTQNRTLLWHTSTITCTEYMLDIDPTGTTRPSPHDANHGAHAPRRLAGRDNEELHSYSVDNNKIQNKTRTQELYERGNQIHINQLYPARSGNGLSTLNHIGPCSIPVPEQLILTDLFFRSPFQLIISSLYSVLSTTHNQTNPYSLYNSHSSFTVVSSHLTPASHRILPVSFASAD